VAKAGLLERRLAIRHDFWMRGMLVLMLVRVLSVAVRERGRHQSGGCDVEFGLIARAEKEEIGEGTYRYFVGRFLTFGL
jgi:hypothetical protein